MNYQQLLSLGVRCAGVREVCQRYVQPRGGEGDREERGGRERPGSYQPKPTHGRMAIQVIFTYISLMDGD